jgi:hypothetical protein
MTLKSVEYVFDAHGQQLRNIQSPYGVTLPGGPIKVRLSTVVPGWEAGGNRMFSNIDDSELAFAVPAYRFDQSGAAYQRVYRTEVI